jgi:AAA15 family ATPase/GTPase
MSEFVIEKLKKLPIQVILTTHNTSLMTNELMRPDCCFLMYKDRVLPLSKRTDKELRFAHNIEKMYKAGTFNE